MTTAKLRNLSQFGVITDVDPYTLPPQAWSRGVNVRFQKGSVLRAPVFRRVPVTLSDTDPRFLTSNIPSSGFDVLYIGYLNGRVYEFDNLTETDFSVFGYVDSDSELPFTSCSLNDVFYVNRGDRVPWSLTPASPTAFSNLANWNANHRAKVLRACGGALCAFGITKSGTEYPTMVRTSSFAEAQSVPASWDESDPSTNATENVLGEMQGPIVDAANFGDNIIIYGYNEAWLMSPDRGDAVWDYRKLPFDSGVINANCVVEIGGVHYVFGVNDIWRHDGVSKQSIADERVRRYIFENIDISKSSRCLAKYDTKRKEIRFCYVSADDTLSFIGTDGCNRCAVYDLVNNTWSFDDLPNVYGIAPANLNTSTTWASISTEWESVAGSWLDQSDSLKRSLVMLGDASTAYSLSLSLYAIDEQGPGSSIVYDVDTNATKGWQLQRDGLDLDELPDKGDLRGFLVIDAIYPQARLEADAEPITFQFGISDNYSRAATFGTAQEYDGDTDVRCDFDAGGRYLFLKVAHDDYHYVVFSGLDLSLYSVGDD